jgi:hypothetical protein
VQQKLGDRWLGFSDRMLHDLLSGAGFEHVTINVGARRAGDPFTVLVAAGRKSSATAGLKTRGSVAKAKRR